MSLNDTYVTCENRSDKIQTFHVKKKINNALFLVLFNFFELLLILIPFFRGMTRRMLKPLTENDIIHDIERLI